MLPFLKVFRVEEGNGLSPFAIPIETPSDLIIMVEQFFKPPERDIWGNSTIDDDDAEDVDLLDEEDDVEELSQSRSSNKKNSLPVSVMEHFVNEISKAGNDESNDDDLISVACEDDGPTAAEETSNETFLRREPSPVPSIISSG